MARDRIAETLERFAYIDTPQSRRTLQKAKKYGLTLWELENLGHTQEWKCAGCEAQFSSEEDDARVDHCHETNVVRGLLCHPCNIALGWVKDDSRRLRRLASYLDATRARGANDA